MRIWRMEQMGWELSILAILPAHNGWVAVTSAVMSEGSQSRENHAYLQSATTGLHILDIGNPENLQQIGLCSIGGDSYGMTVAGDRAYVANGYNGLVVIQLSGIAPTVVQNPSDQVGNPGDHIILSGWATGTPSLIVSVVIQWRYSSRRNQHHAIHSFNDI